MVKAIAERQQQVLHDIKWHVLIKRTWLLRHIPFIELAFGSGSLAVGNVDNESDFDLLIGARRGRIFTARFFATIYFGVFGWRRSKEHGNTQAANKMCLNHFVTRATYRLQLPHNEYWRLLYQRLVPVYGSERSIQEFFDANRDWAGERGIVADERYRHQTPSGSKLFIEQLLSSSLGDKLERWLKGFQVRRIERGLHAAVGARAVHRMRVAGTGVEARITLPPLIIYTDDELEFHPDPAVIEME